MASEFKLPELGENIESGDIVNVLVKEGDDVAADQTVFEVETGKATVDLPSPQAGRISKVHVQKGSKVKVGDALLTFESADKQAAPAPQAVTAPQATAAPQTTAAPRRPRRSPRHRRARPPRLRRASRLRPPSPSPQLRLRWPRRPSRTPSCRRPVLRPGAWPGSWESIWRTLTARAPAAGSPKRTSRPRSARGRAPAVPCRCWRRRAPRPCRPGPTVPTPGARFAARRCRPFARPSR